MTVSNQTLLGSMDIRLLDLLPAAAPRMDIRCKLRTVNMMNINSRFFEALSYTWGDMSHKTDIFVDDQKLSISQNLELFLRQRRDQKETISLWIDAICINQEDITEKNAQIPIMNMIYGYAHAGTIWLGAKSNDSDLGMDTLSELGSGSAYEKMPVLDAEVITAISNIFQRPWWTRVWIIQEVVFGGMGSKIQNFEVRCGDRQVLWAKFVIAAARMKAHQEDLRQYFPAVKQILGIDSLRDSALELILNYLDQKSKFQALEFIARFRHFQASDPRDKIYALSSLAFGNHLSKFRELRPRYDAPVSQVYAEFARYIIASGDGPNLLRHCCVRQQDVPSWVPDWSISPVCTLLPLHPVRQYTDVPWWAEPEESHEVGVGSSNTGFTYRVPHLVRDKAEAERNKQNRIKRLEVDVKGGDVITSFDQIPPNFTAIHTWPKDLQKELQELLDTQKLVLFVGDEHVHPSAETKPLNACKQGERETERNMKAELVKDLGQIQAPYAAAADSLTNFETDPNMGTLTMEGISWDSIDIIHEGFPHEIDKEWQNTTRFIVAVGQCKMMAMDSATMKDPYKKPNGWHKAFWLSLFAGQVEEPGVFTENSDANIMCYEEWLPRIPGDWIPSTPDITPKTEGHLQMLENARKLKPAISDIMKQLSFDDKNQAKPPQVSSDTFELNGLVRDIDPIRMNEEDLQRHRGEIEDFASLWSTQPFDLYHRPFRFLNVVPDPFWETRKTRDTLALEKTARYVASPLVSDATDDVLNVDENACERQPKLSRDEVARLKKAIHKVLKSSPSIVPQGTLPLGMERYALGRRFIITKRGYFGLVPQEAKRGDVVTIPFGSAVPFILRRHTAQSPGQNAKSGEGWQMIGEAYVQGIMQGEVMKELKDGLLEAETFTLY